MAKKNEKSDDNSKYSFKDDKAKNIAIENEVDKMLGISDNNKNEEPEPHHITEKIQTGMEIKNNLPDKGFLNVKAEEALVKYTNRYGEEFLNKKVIITSKDIKNVEYVEITDGLFNIDLRNDANFWFIRSPVVVPSMITQAVRTHLDIKKCHDPEKRKIELPLILILALIGGAAIILIMLISLMS